MQNKTVPLTAREALLRRDISLQTLEETFAAQQHAEDMDLILLQVQAHEAMMTAQVTGVNLQTNTLSYRPVHIYFNEDGSRQIQPVKTNLTSSLDDPMFY